MQLSWENLDKDFFIELLQNQDLLGDDVLFLIKRMYGLPKHGLPVAQLASLVGWGNAGSVNSKVVAASKRVLKQYNIAQRRRNNGTLSYWDIFFNGYSNSEGFVWELKTELTEALEYCGLVKRNTYLFAWNPQKWARDDIEEKVQNINKGMSVVEDWSCQSYKSIRVGDRAFVVKVGDKQQGIFASGTVISEPFLGNHWSGNRVVEKVLIEFDTILNPYKEPILFISSLTEDIFRNQHWYPQKSGISINNAITDKLEITWAAFINYSNDFHIAQKIVQSKRFTEGAKKEVLQTKYERNPGARIECLNKYGYVCVTCNFNFEKTYGILGRKFIHVHHIVDISLIGEEYIVDPIEDLRPVCPNCHAMLHKKRPAYTIEDLKDIIQQNKNN